MAGIPGFNFGPFIPTNTRAFIKEVPQKGGSATTNSLVAAGASLLGVPAGDRFEVDVVSADVHTFNNVVPENPLENGSFTTDHVTILPYRLDMEFVITDTPINAINPASGVIESGRGRYQGRFSDLEKMRDRRNPLTVATGLKVYKNMMFESLVATRDGRGHAVRCSASFIQLQIAFSENGQSSFPDESVETSVGGTDLIGLVSLVPLVL